MKYLMIVASLLLLSNMGLSFCSSTDTWVGATGNNGSFPLATSVNWVSVSEGCTRNWGDKVSVSVRCNNKYVSNAAFLLNSSVNLDGLTNLAYAQYPGDFIYTDQVKFTFEVVISRCCGYSNITRKINMWCYHGYSNQNKINLPALCSDKTYDYLDLITPYTNPQITNKSWNFEDGSSFPGTSVNFVQQFDNVMSYVFSAVNSGKNVMARHDVPINVIKNVNWLNVPVGLNNQSNTVLLNNYTSTDAGGIREYLGLGTYMSGNQWVFNPSYSGPGSHQIKLRSNNNGCYSAYKDSTILVGGVTSVSGMPTIDLEQIFGPGETGEYLTRKNVGAGALTGVAKIFHYGCGESTYTLNISNPEPYINYEFLIMYHDTLYASGLGQNFVLNTPTNVSVDVDVNETGSTYFNNYSYIDEFIFSPLGKTIYLGDKMEISVRKVNILNQVGAWNRYVFGLMKKPKLPNNSIICSSDTADLISTSTTPVYISNTPGTSLRLTSWDIDMDGDFEFTGDTITHIISGMKVNSYIAQVKDKSYIKTFEFNSTVTNVVSIPSVDVECFSDLDTVLIIHKPEFTTAFNEIGTVNLGTPVRGIVTGSYFDGLTDSIKWNFSDGSPTYYGDTVWHYMNDLGTYDLEIEVIDNYGCSVQNQYLQYWFCPGTLETEQLEKDENIIVYPNPTNDVINIQSVGNINYEIYSIHGQLIGLGEEKSVSLSSYKSGIYYIKVIGVDQTKTFEIIKK